MQHFKPACQNFGELIENHLPALILETIKEVSESIQVPIEMSWNSALSSISAAAQGIADVEVFSGSIKPISLYTITIAESGDRKTTVDRIFSKPFSDYEAEAKEHYEKIFSKWKTHHEIWVNKKKSAQKDHQKGLINDDQLASIIESEPIKPQLELIQISDATTEALILRMSQSGFALVASNEGGAIMKSRFMKNLELLNTLWDGQDYSKILSSCGKIEISNPRTTLNFMVQNKILEDFLTKKGESARSNGFLARCLFTKPESLRGKRMSNRFKPSKEHINAFNLQIRNLLNISMQKIKEKTDRKTLKISEFDTDYINEFSDFIERNMAPGAVFCDISDAASKARENALRIAACLHLFSSESEGEFIESNLIIAGCQLALEYLHEFKSIFDIDPMLEIEENSEILKAWLDEKWSQWGSVPIKKSDIMRLGPSRLRDKSSLEKASTLLHQRGVLCISTLGKTTFFNQNYTQPTMSPRYWNNHNLRQKTTNRVYR